MYKIREVDPNGAAMSNEKQRMTFLSYSQADKNFAIKLAKKLKSEGFHIWLDQLDIPVGSRWDEEIEKALVECQIFMVILTPSALASKNVKDEIMYAIESNKHILPLVLEKCNVPFRLMRFQYVDFSATNFDNGVESVGQWLRNLIMQPTVPRINISAEHPLIQAKEYPLAQAKASPKAKEAERRAAQKAEAERLAKQKARAESQARESHKINIQDEVFFTAYHPTEGNIETWHTLLVYAHTLPMVEKVREDAGRFNDQIKSPRETRSRSSTPIARKAKLTIIPSCEGITFNPERVSFKWMEDIHRADFRFKADKSLSDDAAKGQITIYVGPLIVGTLKFAMLFNDRQSQPAAQHEENAKIFGKDDVFISYSRKDSEVARAFKNVLEGTGLDVFLDVDNLRSGQLWEDELKRRIERARIFQIFWSANYSRSENCKLEWEYALKQNKDEGYIRPVFWKKPISPKPPEELNKFNFKYVQLPDETRSFITRFISKLPNIRKAGG
jgi:hypothetical protein